MIFNQIVLMQFDLFLLKAFWDYKWRYSKLEQENFQGTISYI